jgi:hypothetical protein
MNKSCLLYAICACVFFAYMPLAQAAVEELGDLNIINDAGNPSNGLGFLDLSSTLNLSREEALAHAQTIYPSARLATMIEHDNLFAAAGIAFDTAFGPVSNILTTPATTTSRSITTAMDISAATTLMSQLGITRVSGDLQQTWIWGTQAQPNPGFYDVYKITVWPGSINQVSVQKLNDTNTSTSSDTQGHLIVVPADSVPTAAELTNDEWILTGEDTAGIWNGSIHFETKVQNGLDLDLTGYFDWIGSGTATGSFGRENFTGTLFSDNRIELIGFEIVPPSQGLGLGLYLGKLSATGTQITDGIWGFAGGSVFTGKWSAIPSSPVVDLSGTIKTADGSDICAMVLASGQFMFSCKPSGVFSLTDLPREQDGTVKRQIYADGFFPKIDNLAGTSNNPVVMTRSGTCPSYNTPYDPGFVPGSAGKHINITGRVLTPNGQTPICAMVLASGQHTFSCDDTGSYAMNIPLDTNGQFKLQVYADGFAPTIQTFDEFKAANDVRMARATECQ